MWIPLIRLLWDRIMKAKTLVKFLSYSKRAIHISHFCYYYWALTLYFIDLYSAERETIQPALEIWCKNSLTHNYPIYDSVFNNLWLGCHISEERGKEFWMKLCCYSNMKDYSQAVWTQMIILMQLLICHIF